MNIFTLLTKQNERKCQKWLSYLHFGLPKLFPITSVLVFTFYFKQIIYIPKILLVTVSGIVVCEKGGVEWQKQMKKKWTK